MPAQIAIRGPQPVSAVREKRLSGPPVALAFDESPNHVQSLQRGLAVIRVFDAGHAALTLSQVAARAGLARAVARRLLMTLEYLGYVTRQGRQFSLTPRILELGFSYLSCLPVATLAQPVMEQVAHEIEFYITNLTDKNAIVYSNTGNFDLRLSTNEPRVIGLRVNYRWGKGS